MLKHTKNIVKNRKDRKNFTVLICVLLVIVITQKLLCSGLFIIDLKKVS